MSHSSYICYKDASKLFCIGNNVYQLFKQRPLIKDLKIPPLILEENFIDKLMSKANSETGLFIFILLNSATVLKLKIRVW